ncbi:PLP-dependent aminotransferase family protein [Phytohabitans sp. ZYX-F-186]|uniref:PLP-dependent aminotransferase family protein n=1 Tax=Phytohabitans maris TaxID=3071409 RepID=A0ABU0ZV24_9ACTN|nr:PLP-dependent aminotransferase family protein [Phytohabitans sp. ZYX-F-186]MDQ7910890.1 PLP-dependent aminotransferase family protein [Phytohabitans sp. ZYX-F-186]
MNFLNEVTARFPGAVSFAPGRPYDEPFDPTVVAGYLDAYAKYLERDRGLSQRQVGAVLFQYGRTKGQIHELVAATVAGDEGIEVPAESIVVTVGAQEGMLLALRALFRDPADVLLVASPCYIGITGAARLLDVAVEPVPEGPSGVDAAGVRAAVARVRAGGRRPRALYAVPDFANPSGTSMPAAARRELLAVAAEEDLFVLEDNPYGLFSRTGRRVPTLKRLDEHRRVVYLGSFAKTCFPGARVGYTIADQPVVAPDGSVTLLADQLSKIKSMTTVNTSPLAQAVVGGMLVTYGCRLRAGGEERIRRYRERLDALLAALDRHFGRAAGFGWNVPDGGFFLVLTVPFVADEAALTRSARDHGVLWTPMSYFYAGAGGERQIRLSCSYLDPGEIDEGVRRLREFTRTHRQP